MIIKINDNWKNKCLAFAAACMESNKHWYAKRNQTNLDKIVEDIYVGKMGEVATYLYFKSLDLPCSKPDFEIYEARNKSYDADLKQGEKYVHVKSQSLASSRRYGVSWILQCRKGDADKLFKNCTDMDYISLCVEVDGGVDLLGIMPIQELFKRDLFKEPKLQYFKGIKKALYWEDIKEIIESV
jgi:hypothetical protein